MKWLTLPILLVSSLVGLSQSVLPLGWDRPSGTNDYVYTVYYSVSNLPPVVAANTTNQAVTLTNVPVRAAAYWVTARARIGTNGFSLESDVSPVLTNSGAPANIRNVLTIPLP